ncbi:hypothetical protein AS850_03320 [Frondihabitans sp. 762G35]|uniref:amidohydrolase family protein n=1 Tax=Frondihabitans sp. 762G35 TaxID=1446794 RepID=UPI000D2080A8|nr:amidohydrolase [Frondihabitans sp. 762G35]ARC56104.1 hypothetical protein AS850_03320 [Frondihabitans sp. 762G35]
MLLSCDDAWFGGWRGPSILRLESGRLTWGGPDDGSAEAHLDGVVLAPFTDSHVHLGLVDARALLAGGIGRVVDLGWDPAVARTWPETARADPTWPEVSIAGGLLGAPGGYPSRAPWAPAEAAVPVATPDDADSSVRAMQEAGASVVKITLNSDAGPVLDDETLDAVVAAAHARNLPVVAHAQGIGQVRRAGRARVDALAHAPFSERLDDDLLDDLARTMTWISTLDIHGHGRYGAAYETAVDNVARFHARGGRVAYGTDLGNGDLPTGLNGREIAGLAEAGLGLADILGALTPGSGHPAFDTRVVTVHDGARPDDGDLPWLAATRALTLPELVRRAE